MTDFRNLQHYIAQIRVSPAPAEYYLEGYRLVRQCYAEAQAVLAAPFNTNNSSAEHPEQQKVLLKAYENPRAPWIQTNPAVASFLTSLPFRVLLDASIRRFRCQKIYLRATAAMRWINSRDAILGEGTAGNANPTTLRGVDDTLQAVSIFPKQSLSGGYSNHLKRVED